MTPERISRYDDEGLYQPRIHSRWIRRLHQISLDRGEPMTTLVDRALREFVTTCDGEQTTCRDLPVRARPTER